MTVKLTSQYEVIGARLARDLKGDERGAFFLKKYSTAPLFIVGLSQETVTNYREKYSDENAEREMHKNFHLPFPIIVLDFPTGLVPGSIAQNLNDQFLMYVETLNEDKYLIEAIKTSEYVRRRLQDSSEYEKETLLSSVSQFKETLDKDEESAGEALACIIEIDRQNGENRYSFSKEFVFDCQIACEKDPSIFMYANYSQCRPQNGCKIQTPICRMLTESAAFGIQLLFMVIEYINRPDRFIIKATPDLSDRELRMKEKGKKLTFNKKPAHIVLDHSQVREIIAASHGGTHAPPLPHQRRGHWRQLSADCFKEKKTIWVRPADINKGLAVRVGKNVYEVVN